MQKYLSVTMSNYHKYCNSCILLEPWIGIQRETRKWTLSTTWKGYLLMGETIAFLPSEGIWHVNEFFSFLLPSPSAVQIVPALQGIVHFLCQQTPGNLHTSQPLEATANSFEVMGGSISLKRISHKSRSLGYRLHCGRAKLRTTSDRSISVLLMKLRFLVSVIYRSTKACTQDRIPACLSLRHIFHVSLRIFMWSLKIKPTQRKAEGMDGKKLIHDENVWTPNPMTP